MSNPRVEQFRQMTESDPDNELGHFSLGRAYFEAGKATEAITALKRALSLNPNLGRAYHLLGQAQLQTGQKTEAIETLQRGATVAASRGEALTRNEIAALLEQLGAALPADAAAAKELSVGEGQVLCSRCGQVAPKLPKPPFKNKQGELIYSKECASCWREWIGMGTKVINELRLPMNEPEAQRLFDKHMYEFLNIRA